jgi:hypothetical protein
MVRRENTSRSVKQLQVSTKTDEEVFQGSASRQIVLPWVQDFVRNLRSTWIKNIGAA